MAKKNDIISTPADPIEFHRAKAPKKKRREGWEAAFRKAEKRNGPYKRSQESIDWLNMPGTSVEDFPAYLKQFGIIIDGTPRECGTQIRKLAGDRRVSVLLIDDVVSEKKRRAKLKNVKFDWDAWAKSSTPAERSSKTPQARRERK